MKEARESLSDVLKDRRNSKSNKHIFFQDQMLGISKFDLDLNKNMMNQFEESDKKFNETITTFAENINKTMSEGFPLMATLIQQQQPQITQPHLLQQGGHLLPNLMQQLQWDSFGLGTAPFYPHLGVEQTTSTTTSQGPHSSTSR